jgi:copper(I)-binding protein
MRIRWWWLLVLMWAATARAAAPALVIEKPWIRALPPGSSVYAAYLVLVNTGTEAVTLTGAQSPAAQDVSLHRSMEHGGMSHMAKVGTIVLAGGEKQVFAPGGLHLMLSGVTKSLRSGDEVPVCLLLSSGRLCTRFPVLSEAP